MLSKVGGSALVVACIIGCAGGRTTSSTPGGSPEPAPVSIASLVGDYALVAVDGHALPYTPRAQGATAIVSGTFQLNANGTFRLQTVYSRQEATGPASAGTCYTEGDEVKMVWDGGGLTNLTRRGDSVVVKREGALYAYIRSR